MLIGKEGHDERFCPKCKFNELCYDEQNFEEDKSKCFVENKS